MRTRGKAVGIPKIPYEYLNLLPASLQKSVRGFMHLCRRNTHIYMHMYILAQMHACVHIHMHAHEHIVAHAYIVLLMVAKPTQVPRSQ